MFDGKPSVPTPHRNNPVTWDTSEGPMLLECHSGTPPTPEGLNWMLTFTPILE